MGSTKKVLFLFSVKMSYNYDIKPLCDVGSRKVNNDLEGKSVIDLRDRQSQSITTEKKSQ